MNAGNGRWWLTHYIWAMSEVRILSNSQVYAVFLSIAFCASSAMADDRTDFMRQALAAACEVAAEDSQALAARFPGARLLEARIDPLRDQPGRSRHVLLLSGGDEVHIIRIFPLGRMRRITVEYHQLVGSDRARPVLSVVAGGDCVIREVRRIRYDVDGRAAVLSIQEADFTTEIISEPLNPPVPAGKDQGGVLVAVVDSGVNYTLEMVRDRLARDGSGKLTGFDYWDMDARPYDVDASRSPFFPLHHGTAVTSIILKEAPAARIIPYRYPRPEMGRMAELVSAADAAGTVIVNMAMGSNKRRDWEALEAAARKYPHILFVISAGNDGRDIDDQPVYPAAFRLDNFLVVTSSDGFGRLAEGSNWGRHSVDVMVPGEKVAVVDHMGAAGHASGSSFAVPRIAALAARLLGKNPDWRARELKRAITGRGRPPRGYAESPVRFGWIPDPTDDFVN